MTLEDAFWTGFLAGIAAELIFVLLMALTLWGLLRRLAAHRNTHVELPYLEGEDR